MKWRVSLLEEEKNENTVYGPVWKSDLPLNAGWATFSSSNSNQAFSITGDESLSLSHVGGDILAHSSWWNRIALVQQPWRVFKHQWPFRLHNFSQIQVWTLTWPFQNLDFVFYKTLRTWLDVLFLIIFVMHNLNTLQLKVTNEWPNICPQDFLAKSRNLGSINHSKSSGSWSSNTTPDHHTPTTVLGCG